LQAFENAPELVALPAAAARDSAGVLSAAPRVDPRLLAAIARIDRAGSSIADVHRTLGLVADWLEIPRPSYEQVRVLVKRHRKSPVFPGVGETLLEIAMRSKPPGALLDVLSGTAPPKRPGQ
jgi:hypothetical protein